MKTIRLIYALCVIVCFSFSTNAQVLTTSKPLLFKNVAPTFPAKKTELDKMFVTKVGSSIQLNFTNNFIFNGTILSSVQRYSNLSCIIIKSPSLQNTLLSLSKRINDDNSVTYVGHILNEGYSDGYELKKGSDGNYAFHKIKTDDLIQDY